MRILATATTCAALALSACGDESTDQADQSPPPATAEQPAPATTQAPDGGGGDRPLPELVAGTESVLGDVADVARRLEQDPRADVSADLEDIRQRASGLAEEARSESAPLAEDAQQDAGQAQAEADQARGRAEQELTEAERRELRKDLAEANDRALKAADRLERVTDPADAAAVARAELRDAEGDLKSAAERLRGDVPPDVRRRIDELERELGRLGR